MPGVLVRRSEYYVARERSETDAELLKTSPNALTSLLQPLVV
jgi:hypothetical protein